MSIFLYSIHTRKLASFLLCITLQLVRLLDRGGTDQIITPSLQKIFIILHPKGKWCTSLDLSLGKAINTFRNLIGLKLKDLLLI